MARRWRWTLAGIAVACAAVLGWARPPFWGLAASQVQGISWGSSPGRSAGLFLWPGTAADNGEIARIVGWLRTAPRAPFARATPCMPTMSAALTIKLADDTLIDVGPTWVCESGGPMTVIGRPSADWVTVDKDEHPAGTLWAPALARFLAKEPSQVMHSLPGTTGIALWTVPAPAPAGSPVTIHGVGWPSDTVTIDFAGRTSGPIPVRRGEYAWQTAAPPAPGVYPATVHFSHGGGVETMLTVVSAQSSP